MISLRSELLVFKQVALVLALTQTVQVSQGTLHCYANWRRDLKDVLIAAAAKMASHEATWGTMLLFDTITRLTSLHSIVSTYLLSIDCFASK